MRSEIYALSQTNVPQGRPATNAAANLDHDGEFTEILTLAIRTRCYRRTAFSSLMQCAAASATAADSGFYLGLGEGWGKYPDAAISTR